MTKVSTSSATRSNPSIRPIPAGFRFDGRIAEDFKLATGTWVSVGPLRARLIALFAAYSRRGDRRHRSRRCVGAVFPTSTLPPVGPVAGRRGRRPRRSPSAPRSRTLARFLAASTGSSTRITRAILLDTPPSLDKGEITDKGSINQRAVLEHRAGLIDALYSPTPDAAVITL